MSTNRRVAIKLDFNTSFKDWDIKRQMLEEVLINSKLGYKFEDNVLFISIKEDSKNNRLVIKKYLLDYSSQIENIVGDNKLFDEFEIRDEDNLENGLELTEIGFRILLESLDANTSVQSLFNDDRIKEFIEDNRKSNVDGGINALFNFFRTNILGVSSWQFGRSNRSGDAKVEQKFVYDFNYKNSEYIIVDNTKRQIKAFTEKGLKELIKRYDIWMNEDDGLISLTKELKGGKSITKYYRKVVDEILYLIKNDDTTWKNIPKDYVWTSGEVIERQIESIIPRYTLDTHLHTIRTQDYTYQFDDEFVNRYSRKGGGAGVGDINYRLNVVEDADLSIKEIKLFGKYCKDRGFYEFLNDDGDFDTSKKEEFGKLLSNIFWDTTTFSRKISGKILKQRYGDSLSTEMYEKTVARLTTLSDKTSFYGREIFTELGKGWESKWVLLPYQLEKKDNILTALTFAFTNNRKDNYIFIIKGLQGSGKSTFVDIISDFGGNCVTKSTLEKITNDPNGFNSYGLVGRTGVFLSELSASSTSNEVTAALKELSGSNVLQAAKKGNDLSIFRSLATYFIEANKIPLFKDASQGAMDRRLKVLEFDNKVEQISTASYTIRDNVFKSNFFKQVLLKEILVHWEKYLKDTKGYLMNAEWDRTFKAYKSEYNDAAKFIKRIIWEVANGNKDYESFDGKKIPIRELLYDVKHFLSAFNKYLGDYRGSGSQNILYIKENIEEVIREIDPKYTVDFPYDEYIVVTETSSGEFVKEWWRVGSGIGAILDEKRQLILGEDVVDSNVITKRIADDVKNIRVRLSTLLEDLKKSNDKETVNDYDKYVKALSTLMTKSGEIIKIQNSEIDDAIFDDVETIKGGEVDANKPKVEEVKKTTKSTSTKTTKSTKSKK